MSASTAENSRLHVLVYHTSIQWQPINGSSTNNMTCTQESKFLQEYKILGHIKETQQDPNSDREVGTSYIPKDSNLQSTAMRASHFSK